MSCCDSKEKAGKQQKGNIFSAGDILCDHPTTPSFEPSHSNPPKSFPVFHNSAQPQGAVQNDSRKSGSSEIEFGMKFAEHSFVLRFLLFFLGTQSTFRKQVQSLNHFVKDGVADIANDWEEQTVMHSCYAWNNANRESKGFKIPALTSLWQSEYQCPIRVIACQAENAVAFPQWILWLLFCKLNLSVFFFSFLPIPVFLLVKCQNCEIDLKVYSEIQNDHSTARVNTEKRRHNFADRILLHFPPISSTPIIRFQSYKILFCHSSADFQWMTETAVHNQISSNRLLGMRSDIQVLVFVPVLFSLSCFELKGTSLNLSENQNIKLHH